MNADKSIKHWRQIAELQLDIIKTQGQIARDNKDIWDILHSWDNAVWLGILNVVADLQESQPDLFSKVHNQAFAAAAEVLVNEGPSHYKVLNKREHKAVYWRFVMCLRELWAALQHESNTPKLFV